MYYVIPARLVFRAIFEPVEIVRMLTGERRYVSFAVTAIETARVAAESWRASNKNRTLYESGKGCGTPTAGAVERRRIGEILRLRLPAADSAQNDNPLQIVTAAKSPLGRS